MSPKRNVYLKMKTLKQAQDILFENFSLTDKILTETVPVPDSIGRVLAEHSFMKSRMVRDNRNQSVHLAVVFIVSIALRMASSLLQPSLCSIAASRCRPSSFDILARSIVTSARHGAKPVLSRFSRKHPFSTEPARSASANLQFVK